MKTGGKSTAILIAGGIAALLLLSACTSNIASIVQGGFTDSDLRQLEQTIRNHYLDGFKESSSAVERQEVKNGSATIDVQMIKVADRRAEGFVKISINTQEARDLGLSEISQSCEATMEVNSSRIIWKCMPLK